MKKLLIFCLVGCGFAAAITACHHAEEAPFVTVNDGHFERGGQPYYFVGTSSNTICFSITL